MAKKKSYAYGICPTCKNVGYHKQKRSGVIYLEGNTKAKCTRFKCKNCGSWFGFYDGNHWYNADEEEVESDTKDWIAIYNYANSVDLSRVNKYDDREAIRNIRSISSRHCTE